MAIPIVAQKLHGTEKLSSQTDEMGQQVKVPDAMPW